MSERYSRLFSQRQNLYSTTSPVVITAGALLKDNQSGKVLVQLKLRNISAKEIKAVKVAVYPFDTAGEPLGTEVEYQYLDLTTKRDEEFGAKTPIFLPDATARAFSAIVTEVIFADNSIWKTTGDVWEALPRATQLEDSLQDEEMLRQYHMKYGEACKQVPTVYKDLWYCTCGALNRREEATCHACACSLSDLQAIDMAGLRAECDERLAEEAKKAAAERAAAEEKARADAAANEARAKKTKKAVKIIAPFLALYFLVTMVIIPNGKYNDAVALMEAGRYEEAIAAFVALDGYKDSKEWIIAYEQSALKSAKVGDYVFFGAYEQDNNTSNGKENIEWLVLEKSDNKILVISRYALDYQPYNTECTNVTWETCFLRTWLNATFLNAAFSPVEQAMIPTVTVSADKNPDYSTDPGKATQDKVFSLSVTEVNQYFSSNSARQCEPTEYAIANGVLVNSDNGNCFWWLRSPGIVQYVVAYVSCNGDANEGGGSTPCSRVSAVRPAMWVEIG